jgi:hypothetical protein
MKLQHLPLGARFEYEGKIFVKTGPLTAASESGGQQIIPRYAVLKPLDQAVPEANSARGRLTEASVRAAFDMFYRTAAKLADPTGKDELEAARQRFFNALK